MSWLAEAYPWIKALHILAVIAWMAGLLYLPRLFVYHADATVGSELSETFKRMERRLYFGIMTPAMIATIILGGLLIGVIGFADQHWLHAKLVLVVILIGLHHMMSRWRRDFAADRNRHPARFYRFVNEVPTLLMIGIVILAVVKPF
jgi:putative membrane protein